jgi:acetyl esterase/lipase
VPEGTELPVILLIHGGGLFMGERGLDRPYSRLLAHKGYMVFSLEYRLAPKANICQQLDDVCAGMDRVGEMLVDCDVDFSRIFLVADSAGAYLACYVSAMHESVKL